MEEARRTELAIQVQIVCAAAPPIGSVAQAHPVVAIGMEMFAIACNYFRTHSIGVHKGLWIYQTKKIKHEKFIKIRKSIE